MAVKKKSTTFGYAQPWWATLNHSQGGYGVILYNAKRDYKIAGFWQSKKIPQILNFYVFARIHN